MFVINTISEKRFSLNGVNYPRIYQPLKQGLTDISIMSIYDSRFKLTDSNHFSQYNINGVIYADQFDTIAALVDVLFNLAVDISGVNKKFGIVYYANTSTTIADPGVNNLLLNNSNYALATQGAFSIFMLGIDISNIVDLTEGSEILVRQTDDFTKFISVTLTGDAQLIDNYAVVNFTVNDSGGTFTQGAELSTNLFITQAASGGGHVIQYSPGTGTPVSLIQRTNLIFVGKNGIVPIIDVPSLDASAFNPYIKGCVDYDATGEAAYSLIQRNATNSGFEPAIPELFEKVVTDSFANITASGQIAEALHRYESKILIISYESNAAINLSLGWSALATDIVNNQPLSIGKGELILNISYNETTNDKDIYATLSGAATVSLKITQLTGV